jgi:hypothetical protein
VFDSQENVRRAIKEALNEAIPNAFHKPVDNQMDQKVYTVRNNPRDILSNLCTKYGTSTPAEKRHNNMLLDAPWDPSDPIEALFDRIEDCFIFALICKPEYTMEQIVDKAIFAIQLTGLYETALLSVMVLSRPTRLGNSSSSTLRRRMRFALLLAKEPPTPTVMSIPPPQTTMTPLPPFRRAS